MIDYVTAKERLSLPKKSEWLENIFILIALITLLYFLVK